MADPITAVIAAVVKIGSAIVAAYKASMVVRIVIHIAAALAIGMVAMAFAAKPGKINQGQELSLKLDPTMPRQVAVGRIATGGSQAWAFTYGTNGDVPNRYLVRILALSDRPASGLVKIQEGGEVLTFSGDPTTGLVPCTTHVNKKGQPCLHVQVVLGSDTPTGNEASWLFAASGGLWTNKHKYTGGCYAIIRSDYDPDAFPNGEPQLVFVLDGAKVEDPRNGTVAFSRNAALITHQLLKGFYTNGSLIVGSEAKDYDFQAGYVAAAANLCDEAVPIGPEWGQGATEPRYRAGMLLTASEPTSSALQDLKNAMDGKIYDRSGRIAILPGAVRTPVLHITDENLDWSAPKSLQPYSSLQSLYNQVNGAYVSEALGFEQVAFPIQKDPAYVIQDGGERIILSQDFRAVNSDIQIQRITKRILKASRFQKLIAFTGPTALYELQQGDWFTMDSARWNLATKYFEALLVTLNEDLRVTIVALETSPVIDGWSTADEVPRSSTGYIPPPYKMPVPILAVTSTSVTQTVGGVQTALPVIDIVVTVPDGSPVSGYKIEYRLATQAITTRELPMSIRDTNTLRISGDLMPGAFYEVRAAGYDGDRIGDWSNWEVVQVSNVFTVPDSGGMGGINWQDWWDELLTAGAIDILPSIPTEEIPGKPVIYNDTDGKLYRWDPNQNKYVKEVDGGDIAQGTLDNLAFVADLQVPGLGSALPALPDAKWPEGSMFVNTSDGKTYTNRSGAWSAQINASDISGTVPAAIPYGPTNPSVGSPDQLFHNTTDGKLYRWTGSGWTAEVASADVVGQLVAGQIANGAITIGKFASGLAPIESVAALPSSGNFRGRTVILQSDGKLYRWNSTATTGTANWTTATAANDITGQLTNAQIAALEASKITGQLTNAQIADIAAAKLTGQITETQITNGAISTPKLAAGAVIADKIASDAITADKVAANAITAVKINAGAVTTAKLAAGAVEADKIAANAVTTDKIAANAVTANELAAGSVVADKVAAGAIQTAALAANAVTASKLFVGDTSNMVPDALCVDPSAWSHSPGVIRIANSVGFSKFRYGFTSAALAFNRIETSSFPVEAGKQYHASIRLRKDAGAVVSAIAIQFRWLNSSGAEVGTNALYNGAITTSEIIPQATFTAPANAASATLRVILTSDMSGSGNLYAFDFVARRAASGELIVDGAITTDKLSANAVTAGKIAAGSITTDKIVAGSITTALLGAGAVTASKLFVGDTSNMFPDPNMVDRDAWNDPVNNNFGTNWNLLPSGTADSTSINYLRINSNASNISIVGPLMYVEPGKEYYVSSGVRFTSTDNAGWDIYARYYTIANGIPTYSTLVIIASSATGSTTRQVVGGQVVIPAGITGMSIQFRRRASSGIGVATFDSPITRRAASGELIVDGAITTDKLAANSVVAGKIAAGAITAAAVAAGAITASKLFVGDTSNIFPDPTLTDLDGYTNATSVPTGHGGAVSANRLVVGLGTGYCPMFSVEGGIPYFFSTYNFMESGTGTARTFVQWFSTDAAGNPTQVGGNQIIGDASTLTPARVTNQLVAPATARKARIAFQRVTATGNASFHSPIVRRASDGELVVDGAITAVKLAANSVTADKIVAGAVTAAKISVSVLSAISANLGIITAGLIRSGTGGNRTEIDPNGIRTYVNGNIRFIAGQW